MHLRQFSQSSTALGSTVDLTIVSDAKEKEIEKIFDMLWLQIYSFEKRFSRFLPASELSKFNRSAGHTVNISDDFAQLLSKSLKLSKATNGLHNPFVLPALQRSGYKTSFIDENKSDYVDNYSACEVVDWNELNLDRFAAYIPKNTAIDAGGCGKGYLADQLAKTMSQFNCVGFWFSLGGDAIGSGLDEFGKPWEIAIQDARSPEQTLNVEFEMDANFCVASSGTITRNGIYNNKKWHHIVDPRTGLPAKTDVLLATVLAESTVEADVLATCAVILGSKKALSFLRKQTALSVLLQVEIEDRIEFIGYGKLYEMFIRDKTEALV